MQWGKIREIDGAFQSPLVQTDPWVPIREGDTIAEIFPGNERLNALWAGRPYDSWDDDGLFALVMSAR